MAEVMDVIVANPAGNTTIFVLTQVPQDRYQAVTDRILDIDFKSEHAGAFRRKDPEGRGIFSEEIYRNQIKGEQVGFILPDEADPVSGEPVFRINMSGMEFCGNAMRAFGFYKGTQMQPPRRMVRVRMSGCEDILTVEVDPEHRDAKAQMPLPKYAGAFSLPELGLAQKEAEPGILVDMDGIFHLVLKDVEPCPESFEKIREYFYCRERKEGEPGDFPAFGVMFIDTKAQTMTPVVYVKDVDTTYFEGSCASGTTAAAFVAAGELPDGVHELTFREPAGTLHTEVTKGSGQITGVRLNGLVELSDVIRVMI